MVKLLLILIFSICLTSNARSQSITVDDLVALSSVSSKNIDNYLGKKGFVSAGKSEQNGSPGTTFIENKKLKSKDTSGIYRTIIHYSKDDADYFVLQTNSIGEFTDGNNKLKKTGFYCPENKNIDPAAPVVYKKNNITIAANSITEDGMPLYTFSLQKKEPPRPNSIRYAEDLLSFDSHEYLVNYFGQKNVKEDVYYFSEKELKKCSVLFPNTNQQATFIWEDEKTLTKLSYILISGILPTQNGVQFSASVSENKWQLKNGLYINMSINELRNLNEEDLEFYGRNSEFAYMVSPESKGSIDLSKIGLTLGCFDCSSSPLLNNKKISIADAIDHSLAMYVVYIMIKP